MNKSNTYSKGQVRLLMNIHYPVKCIDRSNEYWYCSCGVFIDFLKSFSPHVDDVLRRIPGDTK